MQICGYDIFERQFDTTNMILYIHLKKVIQDVYYQLFIIANNLNYLNVEQCGVNYIRC